MKPISLQTALNLQGMAWLAVGLFLLSQGVLKIALLLSMPEMGTLGLSVPLLIACGLLLGWLKARFILIKVVKRTLLRLGQFKGPIPPGQIFEKRYLLFVVLMMALGIGFRFLIGRQDLYGLLLIAIGSALIRGALFFVRCAQQLKSSPPL